MDTSELSYRDLQRKCKDLSLPATGKREELCRRLEEAFSQDPDVNDTEEEEEGDVAEEPGPNNVQNFVTPTQAVPGSPFKQDSIATGIRRSIAKSALDIASKTPLPAQYSSMGVENKKSPTGTSTGSDMMPQKRASGGFFLLLCFLLVSTLLAAVSMYTCRINWTPVMETGDLQAGVKEWAKQAQALANQDHALFQAKKELLTINAKEVYDKYLVPLPEQMKKLNSEKMSVLREAFKDLPSKTKSWSASLSKGSTSGVNSCQGPVKGFKLEGAASALSTEAGEEYGISRDKFLSDLVSTSRVKAVAYVAEFSDIYDVKSIAEATMKAMGCSSSLDGQCMFIDIDPIYTVENQGADIQAMIAPQLKAVPSTLFFVANIDSLDPSGAAVMLALLGEYGIINEPGCDISAQAAAAVILHPVDVAEHIEQKETLEELEEWVAVGLGDSGDTDEKEPSDEVAKAAQTTAAALRRRLSNNVLRLGVVGDVLPDGPTSKGKGSDVKNEL